jgi:C1A family cysteine protease
MGGAKLKKHFLLLTVFVFAIHLTGAFSFATNLDEIRIAIKEKGAKWIAGETSVSNLSDREKQFRLGLIKPTPTGKERVLSLQVPPTGLPTGLDWRSNGGNFVTPVRDQGSCASCWAFATTGALESYILIKDNLPGINDDRAEEILLSCGGGGTCNGGAVESASDYIRDTGLPPESYFPYTASSDDDTCSNALMGWESHVYKVVSWSWVNTGEVSIDATKNALYTYGPLVAPMIVYDDFYSYKDGIYEYTTGNYQGAHAVLTVGYQDDLSVGGGGYFIVKNSWGTLWGQGGYFNIAYSQTASIVHFGQTAIAYEQVTLPSLPVAPSGLSATAGSSSQVDLKWTDNSDNEDFFEIQGCTGSGCSNFAGITRVAANVTGFNDTGLTANTTYTYRVRAYNSVGTSIYSNKASAKTLVNLYTLTSTKTGMGTGTVTGIGINCGLDCSETYEYGTVVILTANPDPVSVFGGWSSGGCSGTGTCAIVMSADVTVAATFNLLGPLSVNEGTIGTQITITDSDLGGKKGKVYIGDLKQKIDSWSDASITVIVNKVKDLATDTGYDVSIEPKGAAPIVLSGAFTLRKPEIDPINTDSGSVNDEITINGMWFGTKKGKVYVGQQKCKVTAWSVVDPATGVSTLTFVVHKKLGAGTYSLEIENKIGRSLSFGFEVK